MNKYHLLFFLVLSHCTISNAQESFYDYITIKDFQVGFQDTLLFDSKYDYEAYNYNGKKPCFIQIWHPVDNRNVQAIENKNETYHYLTINDFFHTKQYENLELVRQEMEKNNKEIFVRDFIMEDFSTGQPYDYGNYTYDEIFNLILNTETKSICSAMSGVSNFPVIIYHHGSQSNSFENFAMAEYFASRGFIFVASNFHLPYENSIWGLKPYDRLIRNEDEESLKTIVRFARSLSNSPFVFFIGHSLGAQMGFRTFDSDTTIKGMVSLETTIEFKKDYEKIKEMWPEVYQKIVTEKAAYPFPVLLCAATGKEELFIFFDNLDAPQISYASTKEEFEHNAYTSLFYLRLFLAISIYQPDREILRDRLLIYTKYLELIHDYLIGVMEGELKNDLETDGRINFLQ